MLTNATVMTTLPAQDIQRALAFYRDKLGLTAQEEFGDGMMFHVGNGSFFIYETPNAGSARNTAMSFMVQDLESVMASLRGQGVVFEEYDFPGLKTINGIADLDGERSAWFVDSEGNILALIERI
jgi:predicted enzyme related to lactoylglutathione lyase